MIRNALPTDANSIARVHISSWQQAYRGVVPDEYLNSLESALPQREASWARCIVDDDSNVIVAEVGGQIVGWISVGASRDDDAVAGITGEVMAIYILAAHWQAGVGTALWKAGLQRLTDLGYCRLTLWVLTENERAIRFYRNAGWIEEAGSQRTRLIKGKTLEEVRYGWAKPRADQK